MKIPWVKLFEQVVCGEVSHCGLDVWERNRAEKKEERGPGGSADFPHPAPAQPLLLRQRERGRPELAGVVRIHRLHYPLSCPLHAALSSSINIVQN